MMKIVLQVSGNIGAAAADPATYGFIGSGFNNRIDTAAGAGTTFGVIGGGEGNYIAPGTNHSSIFSGIGNTVAGNCSSILGGANNNDNGHPFTGIYGTGVNGLALAAGNGGFFVNELVIQDIPVVDAVTFGVLMPGQVYTTGAAGSGFMGRPLFIA